MSALTFPACWFSFVMVCSSCAFLYGYKMFEIIFHLAHCYLNLKKCVKKDRKVLNINLPKYENLHTLLICPSNGVGLWSCVSLSWKPPNLFNAFLTNSNFPCVCSCPPFIITTLLTSCKYSSWWVTSTQHFS